MKIGFIGAGKVGTAFSKHLHSQGFKICGYYSEPYSGAVSAAELTESKAFTSLEDFCRESELIFITTPDDIISEVAVNIARLGYLESRHIIGHMSGALSSRILTEAVEISGCDSFSLHPLQAFAELNNSLRDLPKTFFSLEGSEKALKEMQAIMQKLGNPLLEIKQEQKTLYHAAACIVSNYLVTLLDFGLDFLQSIGIEKNEGLTALMPLIEGSLNNTKNLGPAKALTGPIARGDAQTVKQHLQAIEENIPEQIKLYSVLALRTLELAQKEKLHDAKKIALLKEYLEDSHG